jgi:hypothetical protein
MATLSAVENEIDPAIFDEPILATKTLSLLIDEAEKTLTTWLQLHAPAEISRLAFNIELLKNYPLIGIDIHPVVNDLYKQIAEIEKLNF